MADIRVMTIDDYESVNELWQQIPEMGINTTDDSREGIEKYLRRNPTTSFVAVDEGRVVGAILAGHDGRRGFIQHLAVLQTHRKQGIASSLVEHAMNALKEEGINKTALLAFKRNETANLFWEKCGFTLREDVNYRNKAMRELHYRANDYRKE